MLISADPRAMPKIRVRVELRTLGDECLLGTVFVNPDQRVSDLMNSTSAFLPFERSDGGFELIAKSVIARVRPHDHNVMCRSSQSQSRSQSRRRSGVIARLLPVH